MCTVSVCVQKLNALQNAFTVRLWPLNELHSAFTYIIIIMIMIMFMIIVWVLAEALMKRVRRHHKRLICVCIYRVTVPI